MIQAVYARSSRIYELKVLNALFNWNKKKKKEKE